MPQQALALDELYRELILDREPESTWWLRAHNFIFGLFVPDQLL